MTIIKIEKDVLTVIPLTAEDILSVVGNDD